MKRGKFPLPGDVTEEVSALIGTLLRTGERLKELTAGEVDAVADRDGRTFVLRRAQDQLRQREAVRQAAILNALPAHIALLDTQWVIVSVNEAWRRFGSANVIQGAGYETGLNYLEICETARQIGAIPRLGLKEAEEVGHALTSASEKLLTAEHNAHHDALTGLANGRLFHEFVNRQLALCRRNRTSLAVLFVDLDGFKLVNDRYGHETGDRLLCSVAARLGSSIRGSDLAARLGGDEFAVLLVQPDLDRVPALARKILDVIAAPIER